MIKMLGRKAVAKILEREYYDMEGQTPGVDYFGPQADEQITAYLAHMATLGWRMMNMTLDEEQLTGVVHSFPQFQGHEDRLQDLHRAAFDHAPEPVEEG